ncbi:MAG TPA: IS21 family transposase, partial [Oscillatoriaceae cyanobacterium]
MTKVELYELIRRANKLEGIGIRALAKRFKIHRRTVRAALKDARPAPRKPTVRPSVKLGPYLHLVRDWLLADREAPPKQRHTARRIWQRLCLEHGCTAAESSVRREVGRLKREIALSMGQAFMPQVHLPGEEAEVDFFESCVELPGGRTKLYHFCMRACHSGREFHLAFPQCT